MSTKAKSKSKKPMLKSSIEGGSEYLSLSERTGGAMAVGSQNVMAEKTFPVPFNVSSGGAKPKRVKKVVDPSKPKRKLSAYNIYVKENMPKLKDVAPKDRMKKLGEMWKASKK